ncbi:hypothetical protein ABPG75_012980 [Micractinium tetrahymenae]
MEGEGEPARAVGLTFGDFLAKMKDPAAADLVRNIKSFIRQFEERPTGQPADPEADSAAVQAFLAQSEAAFRQHPVWRGSQPEVLDQAVEGLEKYVMSKVWRQTFGACDEDRERDERYQRLMQALGFVDLPTLMGAEAQPDETLLGMAQAELLKMDRYKAPRDKLLCLVNVKTMVENIVGLAAKAGANIGGADAFFPVFLFVLIRSRLPRLASNVEYVKRFRMRSRLSGQFDYMLCNLESGAMYLDTVNYEHLAVSQEAFLRHLAAAGIPEAHLELRRMQQEAEQAAAAGAAVAGAAAGAGAGAAGGPAADYGTPDRQQSGAVQVVQQGGEDSADVLAGLELASGSGTPMAAPADGELSGLGSAQHSMPATPIDTTAALFGSVRGSREGSLGGERSTSLTPLPGEQSPVLLAPSSGGADGAGTAARAAEAAASTAHQQQQQAGGMMPRGLSFQSASELASVAEQQEQRQQQQRQAAEEQAAAAQAVAAAAATAAAQQQYAEAALIEEMVAEGTRHVLAAEAAGQLQHRYPFMYAQAEDLSLADVQAVLVGYKELLLRYEALSRALQQQLGLGAGSPTLAAAAAAAEASLGARHGSAHRSKEQQRHYGFGSLIPPGLEGMLPEGRQQSGGAAAAAEPETAAASSGRWSPGGLLQRIASKTRSGRSLTPPGDRDGSRTAADEEAAAEAARAGSPSKQSSSHPIFATLFGSSSPKLGARAKLQQAQEGPAPKPASAQQQQQQQQQPQQPPQQQLQQLPQHAAQVGAHVEPAGSAGSSALPAHVEQPRQQQTGAAGTAATAAAAADDSEAGPEPSFAAEQESAQESAGQGPAGSARPIDTATAAAAAEPSSNSGRPAAAPPPAVSGSLLDAPLEAQAAGLAKVEAEAGQHLEQPGPAAGKAAEDSLIQLDASAGDVGSHAAAVEDLLGLQLSSTGEEVAAVAGAAAAEGDGPGGEQPPHSPAAEPLSLL